MEKKPKDFFGLAKSRKTTYEFSDKNISDSNLKRILEAGSLAPSANNIQNWSFIVIKNPKTITSLNRICYYGGFHTEPPLMIALVIEPAVETYPGLFKGQVKELSAYHEYINISFPILNMVYAALSFDIDSAILSPVISDANKILKVPSVKKTSLILALGYEKKGAKQPHHGRKELKDLVHYEKY